MTRAKNDRNVVKFGPAPANVESEVRNLRREQFAESFRLTQGGLLLPDLEPGVPVAPPVVVPGDLNTVLQAGFPYVLNSLSGVFASYRPFGARKFVVGEGGLAGNDGFMITGNNSVHFVEIPSGSTTTLPLPGYSLSGSNAQAVGPRVVASPNRSRRFNGLLAVSYNYDTGQYQNVSVQISEVESLVSSTFTSLYPEYYPTSGLVSINSVGHERASQVIRLPDNKFAVTAFYRVNFTYSRPVSFNVTTSYYVAINHVFDVNLNRTDYASGISRDNTPEHASSGSSFYVSGNVRIASTGVDALYTGNSAGLSNVKLTSSRVPLALQIDKGFVDSEGRLVFMEFNPASGLWEIHRLNSFGVRSTLPLVFSGNPNDQPNIISGVDRGGGALYTTTSRRRIAQAGVAPGPDGGYFVYGQVVDYFGEVQSINNNPVFVGVPAIWFTNGVTTQRVWTLPDSPEFPLELLYGDIRNQNTHQQINREERYSFAQRHAGNRLSCGVSYLTYDPSRRTVDFIVRVGSGFGTVGAGSQTVRTHGSIVKTADESRLYRVKL